MANQKIDVILALIPLIPPLWLIIYLLSETKLNHDECDNSNDNESICYNPNTVSVSTQLIAYIVISILGFISTHHLIPNIKVRHYFCIAEIKVMIRTDPAVHQN